MITVGHAYRQRHGAGFLRLHVRAIVDDEVVVYRIWTPHKAAWCYYTGNLQAMIAMIGAGTLNHVGPSTNSRQLPE